MGADGDDDGDRSGKEVEEEAEDERRRVAHSSVLTGGPYVAT